MKKSVALLCHEHELIGEELHRLDRLLAPIQLDRIRPQLDRLGLLVDAHRRRESEVFFPAIARISAYAKMALQAIDYERELESEHLEAARHIFNAPAEDTVAFDLLVRQCRTLTQAIRDHMRWEESLIFNAADKAITAEEDEILVRKMAEIATPLPAACD